MKRDDLLAFVSRDWDAIARGRLQYRADRYRREGGSPHAGRRHCFSNTPPGPGTGCSTPTFAPTTSLIIFASANNWLEPRVRSPVADLLADLSRAFTALDIPWYLFGAQAAIVYGVARLTGDVDVTVRAQALPTPRTIASGWPGSSARRKCWPKRSTRKPGSGIGDALWCKAFALQQINVDEVVIGSGAARGRRLDAGIDARRRGLRHTAEPR